MRKLLLMIVLIGTTQSAMAVSSTVAQKEWRWRNDNGNETTATWKALQNQAFSQDICTSAGQNLRLRMVLEKTPPPGTTGMASALISRDLSYSTSPTGPWTTITRTSPQFIFSQSSIVANGTPTTQQLVSSSAPYGGGMFLDSTENMVLSLMTNDETITNFEFEWVIQQREDAQAGTYYFKSQGVSSTLTPLPSLTLTGGTHTNPFITTCETEYESPSGNYTWTTSGVYNDTLTSSGGCDSVIVTNITFATPTASTINPSACDTYTSPSENYTWTTSGIYNDTIENASGCDSVMTINLTINHPSASTINPSACESYTSPSGEYNWTTSGTYTDIVENYAGCDSVITVNLSIRKSNTVDVQSACNSFTWNNGITYTESTSSARDTLTNIFGCDSIVTLLLTIDSVSYDVSLSGITLTADHEGAENYKWINCANGSVVQNGFDNFYTAIANGNYAVIITENSCSDTSECLAVTTVGLNELEAQINLSIAPNPSSGIFSLSFNGEFSDVLISDVNGSVIYNAAQISSGSDVDLSSFANGVYLVKVQTEKGFVTKRIIKN